MKSVKTLKNVMAAIGGKEHEDILMGDVWNLFLQITLALLFPFLIISFIFIAKSIATADYWKERYEGMAGTPQEEQFEKREEALIELQKQKLLNALEKVENEYRTSAGLIAFSADGRDGYDLSRAIQGDLVVDKRFVSCCGFAKQKIPQRETAKADWLKGVLESAQMRSGGGMVAVTSYPDTVTEQNMKWLRAEIGRRVDAMHSQCCRMQREALAIMQRHYQKNPESLKGTKAHKLVQSFISAQSPEERDALVSSVADELYQHTKDALEKQGVTLLSGV